MPQHRALPLLLVCAVWGLPSLGQGQLLPKSLQGLDYEASLKIYRKYMQRDPLFKRARARLVLGKTGDPRALQILSKGYARPEAPKDHVRYLLASILGKEFAAPEHVPVLEAMRDKHKKAADAWLWYSLLVSGAMAERRDVLRQLAFGRENIYLRGAALAALAQSGADEEEPELAQQILDAMLKLPSGEIERGILLEGFAAILVAKTDHVRGAAWRPVCAGVIASLNDQKIGQRTKVALSRQFAKLFDTANLGFSPRLWLFKLKQDPAPEASGPSYTVSAFFGIRSLGERICYVIDASDSMMKKVGKEEKKRLAAITGPRDRIKTKRLDIADKLPWDKINTRFDVAVEYLKLSLAQLDPSKAYAVVLFGTKAAPLASTPKLMPATVKNLNKTIAELSGIRGGPPTANRPDGVLRGYTNLHGGLLRAFRMTKTGLVNRDEYVNKKALQRGCDTVFVLSDGAPSMDDFVKTGLRDDEDQAGDPETGAKANNTPKLEFFGPYVLHRHLLEDVRRLNLFRRAQIHCIAFGEADHRLLQKITDIGLGKLIKINPPKGKAAGK